MRTRHFLLALSVLVLSLAATAVIAQQGRMLCGVHLQG